MDHQLTLAELIEALEELDPARTVDHGFGGPILFETFSHLSSNPSSCGEDPVATHHVVFERTNDTTVGAMLEHVKGAVDDAPNPRNLDRFATPSTTWVHVIGYREVTSARNDKLTESLLGYMFRSSKEAAPRTGTSPESVGIDPIVEKLIERLDRIERKQEEYHAAVLDRLSKREARVMTISKIGERQK